MTNTKSQANQVRPRRAGNDSFLEAMRGLGSDVADSFGELKPNQALDFDRFQDQEEKLKHREWGFQQDYLNLHKQEQLVWTRHEQEVKTQIGTILAELKQLAASTKNLAKEVTLAAEQVPAEAGVYHINFFQKLRLALVELRKRVEESATWLAAFNQKSKKRNYYWGQFKKSGTKFTLSADRYMSTQVG